MLRTIFAVLTLYSIASHNPYAMLFFAALFALAHLDRA
jgi:hypothetical protein